MIFVYIVFWVAVLGLTGATGRAYGYGYRGYWVGGLLGLFGLAALLILGHHAAPQSTTSAPEREAAPALN